MRRFLQVLWNDPEDPKTGYAVSREEYAFQIGGLSAFVMIEQGGTFSGIDAGNFILGAQLPAAIGLEGPKVAQEVGSRQVIDTTARVLPAPAENRLIGHSKTGSIQGEHPRIEIPNWQPGPRKRRLRRKIRSIPT